MYHGLATMARITTLKTTYRKLYLFDLKAGVRSLVLKIYKDERSSNTHVLKIQQDKKTKKTRRQVQHDNDQTLSFQIVSQGFSTRL